MEDHEDRGHMQGIFGLLLVVGGLALAAIALADLSNLLNSNSAANQENSSQGVATPVCPNGCRAYCPPGHGIPLIGDFESQLCTCLDNKTGFGCGGTTCQSGWSPVNIGGIPWPICQPGGSNPPPATKISPKHVGGL